MSRREREILGLARLILAGVLGVAGAFIIIFFVLLTFG